MRSARVLRTCQTHAGHCEAIPSRQQLVLFSVFGFSAFNFPLSILYFLISGGAAADFVAHSSCQHQRDHFLVRPPGPQRVLKRSGPVVLHEEVRNPRQRVRNYKRQDDPPPALQRDRGRQQCPSRQRPREVNRSRAGLAVRADIFGPEGCEVWFSSHWPKHSKIRREILRLLGPTLRKSGAKEEVGPLRSE